MDESGFRHWLALNGVSTKLACDTTSRLKKIARVIGCDIDEHFAIDGGKKLVSFFDKRGYNSLMSMVSNKELLPLGESSMATYKAALRKYLLYKSST